MEVPVNAHGQPRMSAPILSPEQVVHGWRLHYGMDPMPVPEDAFVHLVKHRVNGWVTCENEAIRAHYVSWDGHKPRPPCELIDVEFWFVYRVVPTPPDTPDWQLFLHLQCEGFHTGVGASGQAITLSPVLSEAY